MRPIAALRALYAEVARARWLQPDAELDAMGPDAVRFLEERLDEHMAALGPHVPPSRDPFELRLRVFRSPDEAASAFRAAWDPDGSRLAEQTAPKPRGPGVFFAPSSARVDVRWNEALRRCAQSQDQQIDGAIERHPGVALRHGALSEAISPHLVSAARRSSAWRVTGFALPRYIGPVTGSVRGPGNAVLRCALALTLHVLEHGEKSAGTYSSPWLPLLALWNRGAWPFALPDGVLAVYVPRLGVHVEKWPVVPHLPPYEGSSDPVTNRLGFGLPARLPSLRGGPERGALALPDDPGEGG